MSDVADVQVEQTVEVQQNGQAAPAETGGEAHQGGDDCKKSPMKTGRQMRQEGQRNLQDSTFSLSEELDRNGPKTSVRVRQPPGGMSSGGFW